MAPQANGALWWIGEIWENLKNDLKYALKDSKGEEIIFHIKNKDGIAVKRVKPINNNEDKNKKPYYSIGIPGYYEKEIHTIIEKLTKDYSINTKK